MNKITMISVIALASIIGLLTFYFHFQNPVSNQNQENSTSQSAQQKWEAQTDDQGNVTVVVTPIDLSPQAKEWTFDIIMDTHSVELDQDMTESSVLIDDKGKEYKPLRWEGPVGGHHREGILIFNQITSTPKSVELKISGIDEVVRSFIWQL